MGGTARVPSCRRRARVRAPAHVFASCFIVASWLRGIGAVTADDVDPFADANVDSRYDAFDHGTVREYREVSGSENRVAVLHVAYIVCKRCAFLTCGGINITVMIMHGE